MVSRNAIESLQILRLSVAPIFVIILHRELVWTMNGGCHMTLRPPGLRVAHGARHGIRAYPRLALDSILM